MFYKFNLKLFFFFLKKGRKARPLDLVIMSQSCPPGKARGRHRRGGRRSPDVQASGWRLAVRPPTSRCPHGTLFEPPWAPVWARASLWVLLRIGVFGLPCAPPGQWARGWRVSCRPLFCEVSARRAAGGDWAAGVGAARQGERGISYSCFLVIPALSTFNGPVIAEQN